MTKKEYVQILADSLKKKFRILEQIEQMNKEQTDLLSQEDVKLDEWERIVDAKAECIDELELLDEGFDSIYQQVKEELTSDKDLYKEQIKVMQEYITKITAKSVDIQAQEVRNRELAQRAFNSLKKKSRVVKQSSRVANIYDTNMKKLNVIDAQFMDRKK